MPSVMPGSRFDQTFVSGHAGPRWLVGRNTEASVQRRWSAGAPDYDALGARAEAGHRFTRRVTANAQVSWHDRRYRTRTLLDGPVMDLSLGGTWVVVPTVRADAGLGSFCRTRPSRLNSRCTVEAARGWSMPSSIAARMMLRTDRTGLSAFRATSRSATLRRFQRYRPSGPRRCPGTRRTAPQPKRGNAACRSRPCLRRRVPRRPRSGR